MNTVTALAITNVKPQFTSLPSPRCKFMSRALIALTTAVALIAARSEYAIAADTTDRFVQGPITLEDAIEIALENNPELAAQGHDVDAAGARRDIALGKRLPEVHLRGGPEFYRKPRLIKPRRPGTYEVLSFTDQLFPGDIALTVPLFTGGRLKNQVVVAELIQQAKWRRLLYNRTELVFNVSSVFYSMLGQEEVINSLIFSRKALEQHRKKVEELLRARKAAKVDLLRMEVRLADIEQQLLRERNLLKIQRYLLASLMGLETDSEPPEIEGRLTLANANVDLHDGLTTAFRNRRDYQSLRTEVVAREKEIEIAKSARWPELSFGASYGDRWAMDSRKHNEVGEAWLHVYVPLFRGGRTEAGIRRERSRLASQIEKLRELKLQIRLEVETAAANINSTFARVNVTQKAVEQGKESLRIEIEKYDQGKGAIVDVLDAQSALLHLQTNYYRALADYNTALAEYHKALGGGE